MVVLKFDIYKSLKIYMFDYWNTKMIQTTLQELGFDSINPSIKLKILSNGNIDIVNTNGQFISDIKLSSQQKKYITNINEKKCETQFLYIEVPPTVLIDNYEDEQYWALTSKMRNYTMDFKFVDQFPNSKDWLAKYLMKPFHRRSYVSGEEYSSESHDSDDSNELSPYSSSSSSSSTSGLADVSDEEMNNSEIDNTVHQLDEGINENESNNSDETAEIFIDNVEGGGQIAHSEVSVPVKAMFNKVLHELNPHCRSSNYNYMVFEYFNDKCNFCTVKFIHKAVIIIEMFVKHHHIDDGSESTPSVLVLRAILFSDINCDGQDDSMHGGDAAYWSGVNIYKDAGGTTTGVIFGGDQLDDSFYDYGSTINDNYIAPDLLLTDEAIGHMNNYTVPETSDEENYWYDYKSYKEAGRNRKVRNRWSPYK